MKMPNDRRGKRRKRDAIERYVAELKRAKVPPLVVNEAEKLMHVLFRASH